VRYRFAPLVAQKIRDFIKQWGIGPKSIAREIQAQFESLAADPSLGQPDPERADLFAGAWFYTFRIDRLPIVKTVTIAYEVARDEEGPILHILDVSPV
jgi:plasmid stabilization system protein ParE